ncbi:MAG: ribonuclease H-like domain-containing protein, partial [Desulfatiglandales bacterium]
MLEHTFIHIPGIGPKTEQHLWRHGILTWKHFLSNKKTPLPRDRDAFIRKNLEASLENRDNIHFFINRLSSSHLWRIFHSFKDKAVYLDIETSGLCRGVDEITIIGLYNGHTVKTFVRGANLSEFESEIISYEVAITFNGSQFDLPFIRRQFPNISLPPA